MQSISGRYSSNTEDVKHVVSVPVLTWCLTSAAVERQLTAEQHAEQLRQVQSMWQMAAVLEFLHTFSLYLQLRGSFTPEELEVAIVSETDQTGLLANLHQVMFCRSQSAVQFDRARLQCQAF